MNIHRNARLTPQAIVKRIEALRRQRMTGPAIAATNGVSPSGGGDAAMPGPRS